MPTYFQRPENALKRANEFIDVGKKQRALDALYDVIKSKKHRTWQKIHEPIMEKYLQLCVELRKSHIAKEGLYQYKNICQQVNIKSLEDVVRKYIRLAESKTEAAKQESHQVVVDIDDLDNPDTPESLLLKAVSGEDTQDRTDRAILTPWVKFLWESYRQCLDLLRNNSRVERLYQDIAQQAFKFCLEYGRKTEFRKLCDNLRTHLGHIHKHQNQQTAINLNNPDSQAMHLETRLVQLDSAINMELWQEAFKAVEDIHSLILLSKKPPKPSLMANYYQKLGLVFWKSNNALFHASTLHKLFHLSREQRKNLSAEELQKMASRVLCATLAIPIPPARNAIDQLLETNESTVEKQRRLATLLMLNSPPTRQGLIKDLVKYNILQHVQSDLQNLYKWLEVEFHPLKLYSRVKVSVEYIQQNDELNQYTNFMEDIIITRVIKQVSQVYQTIEFSRIAGLVPFASSFRLERVIVEAARTLDLQVRIDHRNKCLSFGTDLMVAQKEDVPEGPYIQSMPSEQIRNQLTGIASALHRAINIIQPKQHQVTREELKTNIINSYRMTFKKDHQRILQRRHIIESRKEELEHMNDQREREEMEQAEEQRKKAYDAEMARLDREAKERERQRRIEEHREIQKKHALEKIEQLKKTDIGAKVLQNLDEEEFATLDVEDIMAKQLEQLEKEKKELQERLKNQERKIDYFARAKRMEEIPLLKTQYDIDSKEAKEFWETMEEQRIENLKVERKAALITRERLLRMKEDKDKFLGDLKEQRKEEFKKKLTEFEEKMKEERKKRLADRKVKRKEERRRKWIKEKEEAEQQARDEALKREREEQERIETEKLEAEKREYEDRLAKLQEQEAKQKAREQEIEEKESRSRLDDKSSSERREGDRSWRGDQGGSQKEVWKPAVREGGWREREKQRIDSWKKDTSPVRGDGSAERRNDSRERQPARDERDGYKERDAWRSAPRDERGGGWRDRRGDDRDRGPPRDRDGDRLADRGPPPREDRWRDRGDDRRDAWRGRDDRDGEREDRWKPRGDRDGWRGRDDRDGGGFRGRDDREGGGFRGRDDRDGGGFRGRDDRDGGGFRGRDDREGGGFRGRDDRDGGGFRGRDDRDGGGFRGRDDREGGGFRGRDDRDGGGFRGRDDRDGGGFRGRDDREGGFRDRGPPRDDREGGFRDRGSGRDDRDSWRGSDRGPREERSAWRNADDRGPPRDDRDSRGPMRDDRDGGGGGSTWRRGERGGGFSRGDRPPRDDRRGPSDREEGSWKRGDDSRREGGQGRSSGRDERSKRSDLDDDGWTTVKY